MSTAGPLLEIEYPESDGQPMGESDLHRDWMVQIIERLKRHYAGQRVYVTGDLILYYLEGQPARSIVPDCFVVLGSSPHRRRIYKLWEEKQVPDVVFEVTSSTTRTKDTDVKPALYARLGVRELFLYDPTADYLDPALQGYRLEGDRYVPISADAHGALVSDRLGMLLSLVDGELVLRDRSTGNPLQTDAEAAEIADQQRRVAEQKLQEAEQKVRALEAELLKRRAPDSA